MENLEKLKPRILVVPTIDSDGVSTTQIETAYNQLPRELQRVSKVDFFNTQNVLSPENLSKLKTFYRTEDRYEAYQRYISDYVLQNISDGKSDIVISMSKPLFTEATLEKLQENGIVTAVWLTEDSYDEATFVAVSNYEYIFVAKQSLLSILEQFGVGRATFLPVLFSEHDKSDFGYSSSFEVLLNIINTDYCAGLALQFDKNHLRNIRYKLGYGHELSVLYDRLEQNGISPTLDNLYKEATSNKTYPNDVVGKIAFLHEFKNVIMFDLGE